MRPRTRRAGELALGLSCALSMTTCGGDPAPREATPAELEGDVALSVAGRPIARRTVQAIADAQQTTPREAADRATFDALCAAEAEARGLTPRAGRVPAYLAARALLDDAGERARAAGPPTDAEVAGFRQLHFLEVDRPPAFVTLHAIIQLGKDAPKEARDAARARALALVAPLTKLGKGLAGTEPPNYLPRVSTTRFPQEQILLDANQALQALDAGVLVQTLPPIGDDGLSLGPGAREPFADRYVAAARQLVARGDVTTEPVETEFGFHVILLLARLPGNRLSDEELREQAGELIVDQRGRAEVSALIASLRARAEVQIDPAADEAMGLVSTREAE